MDGTQNTGATPRKPPVNEQDIQRMLRIKDFYEILGITKTSTDEEIKRQYKKLALRYHPDKLRLPGAQEVFKKIAQAYDCMTDPDKRAFYDRTGSDEPQQQQRYEQHYYQQEFDPNDLFNAFFGNGFFSNQQHHTQRRQRTYHTDQGNGRRDQQEQRQGSNMMGLLQLLPFVLIMFSGVFSQFFQESPEYSMGKHDGFTILKRSVFLNLNYYVDVNFEDKIINDVDYLPSQEWKIEAEYVQNLKNNCIYQQNQKRQFANQSRMSWSKRDQNYYQRLSEQVDLTPCNELDDLAAKFDISRYY